uniref:Uncharacterized protein n=1 Tax=Tanacetum cinerariifolium TaxID=118510 RepID=A0A6L2L643_TANCI|nr:hypothetical protein [Tanacetum cinerariifolium]
MMVSIRRSSTVKLRSSSQALLMFIEQSHDEKPNVDNFDESLVRIIPSLASIVQAIALHKQEDIHEGGEDSVMLTQEYIRKVVVDVGEDRILSVARGLAQVFPLPHPDGLTKSPNTLYGLDAVKDAVRIPVRIIPGPADIVQAVTLRKQADIHEGRVESVMSTQEYIRKVDADVGDERILNVARGSVVEFVNANLGIISGCLGDIKNYFNIRKLDQVVSIINSNFKRSIRNLIMVFYKDTVPRNASGVGGSGVGGSGVGGSGCHTSKFGMQRNTTSVEVKSFSFEAFEVEDFNFKALEVEAFGLEAFEAFYIEAFENFDFKTFKDFDFEVKAFDFEGAVHRFIMDDPNITIEEYIRLEEEKARKQETRDDMWYAVNRMHVLDFVGLPDDMRQTLRDRLSMGQAPKKVTGVDLFYLCSMDRGTANVLYLLAQYLFRYAKGRRSGARLSGGHFIRRLAAHFRLVSDQGLRGLSVVASVDELG